MQALRRRHLSFVCLTLLGTVLGAVIGFWLGRFMLLRAARADISNYAVEVGSHGDQLAEELAGVFRRMEASETAFCSEQQIALSQAETFRARGLKDVGKTHDGKVYCSAFLGHLKTPFIEGAATMVLADGVKVYTDVPVVIAAAEGMRATVFERRDTDAVLSPDAFDRWDRPYVRSTIFAVDRKRWQVVRVAGSRLEVDPSLVLSGGRSSLSGFMYQSHCSAIRPLCVVTSERIADVWNQTAAIQIVNAAMGAVAGFGFGLSLALLYLRARAPRNQLLRDLIRDSRSLRLVYQPLIDITTRRCVGAEALLRWTDNDGNTISPEAFISVAEENGFIGEVTTLVVRRAARELGDLLRQHRELTLSINIAAADLHGHDLFPLLNTHVKEAGIYPSQIALELTERSTAHVALIGPAMDRLSREGYKIHIDDFGIGYSSLAYLEQLSVDAIKIDRAFTQSIGTDAVIAPLLPQILTLANALGIEIVVEGVETEAQANYLEATGKRLQVQGWLFGKPLTAEALAARWEVEEPSLVQVCETPMV